MNSIDRKRCLWVVVSALAQGLLLGAYSVTRSGPFLCVPLTLVVIVPFVFWLAQEHWGCPSCSPSSTPIGCGPSGR